MMDLIKVGVTGYICYKALKCFGKQDYADVIGLVSWVYIGGLIFSQINVLYNSFMNSSLVQLLEKIFG